MDERARTALQCRVCDGSLSKSDAQCGECGFTWLGDAYLGGAFDYASHYDEGSSYNSLAPERVLDHYRRAPNTAWALAHLARLRQRVQASTLFELGASQGAFMALARELGYAVRGVELAPASVQYGRERLDLGDALEEHPWRAPREGEARVDVVCAFEVLEHSDDPIAFLRTCLEWLVPGGHLFLSVPNGRRLSVRVGRREPQDRPPHHLMYWTRAALTRAVERCGLVVVDVRTSDLARSDLATAAMPLLSARRAAELGSFRPVGDPAANGRPLPRWARVGFSALGGAGNVAARILNYVPEIGPRLMLMARAPQLQEDRE